MTLRLAARIGATFRSTRLGLGGAGALLGLALLAGPGASEPPPAAARPIPRPPIFFAANEGQGPAGVDFLASGRDMEAAFGRDGVAFAKVQRSADPAGTTGPQRRGLVMDAATGRPLPPAPVAVDRVRLSFVDARPDVRPEGRDPLPTTLNVFKGPREAWITGVRTYARVVYPELWPGIDLEYGGDAGALKYHFVVHPGADPDRIRLAWQGSTGLRLDAAGRLRIGLPRGALEDGRPLAFQPSADGREPVAAAFALEPGDDPAAPVERLRFAVGAYDPSRELVIDPAYPVYAGFFGDSSYDRGLGIAVDAAGHAYISGETTDPFSQDTDAYVAKIALDGSGYDYISVLGGDGYDAAYDVVVDAAGRASITGATLSDEASFPITLGPDLSFNGVMDTLVAQLSPDGADLVFAGYLGGELSDFGEGIRVDDAGFVYLHGVALSSQATFPVKVGPDLSFNGETDAFVAKLRPLPDAAEVRDNLVYAGYIGGARSDITILQEGTWATLSSGHIGIDDQGALYVSGQTTSEADSFPDGDGFGDLPGADQTWAGGWDAYLVKVRPDGSRLDYATYVGGAGTDTGKGMAVDAEGHAYLTGYTDSTEATMPVGVGPDLSYNGGDLDVFVGKLAADGSAFDFLGFFGGDDTDAADAIALDAQGRAVVVGYTESQADSFPAKGGPDASQNDRVDGAGDAFVARLVAEPSAPELRDNVDFAGYIGGAGYDQAFWVGLDAAGGIYVVGDTESEADSFPGGEGLGELPGPLRQAPGGGDGFVVKLAAGEGVATPEPSALPPTQPAPTASRPPEQGPTIFLPLTLDASGLEGLAAAPAPGRAGGAATLAQAAPVERSFDDFCDFGVGWAWEADADIDIRLDVDALGTCSYIMQRLSAGAYGATSSAARAPEDFLLETRAHLAGGDGAAGLMFGASERLDAAYVFALFADGQYLLIHIGDQTTRLGSGTVAIDPAEPLALAVQAQAGTLTLLVDGQVVDRIADAGPHAGRVGTYVEAGEDDLPHTSRFDFIRVSDPALP